MTINWKAYTGTDEQIAEIYNSKNGYVLRLEDGQETNIMFGDICDEWKCIKGHDFEFDNNVSHCWIIPDDPLREMKIRQAQTGQPVYIRWKTLIAEYQVGHYWEDKEVVTTKPDWDIPNAEYSFSPFEDYACFT